MNDKQQTKPAPDVQTSADKPKPGPERIPVRVLRFFQPHPSFLASTSITADPAAREKGNRAYFVIDFIPSMRHHRVEFKAIDAKAPVINFVQEVHVASWEPAT